MAIKKVFDYWIITTNRYGEEDGYFYEGDMIISDPLGQLHRTAVGKVQFMCERLIFVINESAEKQTLRRINFGISFISFLLEHIGLKALSIWEKLKSK